jgi:ubiquinone/menaquinone biosynthesis C-methylase UbiE
VPAEQLRRVHRDLRWVNRWLGGHAATGAVLDPLFEAAERLRILDVGTGGGDVPVDLVRRGAARGCRVEVVGLDADPTAVAAARARLDGRFGAEGRGRIRLVEGDARSLPFTDGAFDVSTTTLVLHHFHGPAAPAVLREMDRVARLGIVVNDLHRHRLAHAGIYLLTRLLGMDPMVQADAPLSVRRGFRRRELAALARQAGLASARIRWHWAFRWTLSTCP